MSRKTKILELSNCTVKLFESITWGEKEQIQAVLIDGANLNTAGESSFNSSALLESKYKAFEICIDEIVQDDNPQKFTREWINNLSVEDGDVLYDAIDEITNPKKKSA